MCQMALVGIKGLSTLATSIFLLEKQDDEMKCKEYFTECLLNDTW